MDVDWAKNALAVHVDAQRLETGGWIVWNCVTPSSSTIPALRLMPWLVRMFLGVCA